MESYKAGKSVKMPDVEMVDEVYRQGLQGDLASASAFLAFLNYRKTKDLEDIRTARFWLDYLLVKDGNRA